MSKHTGSTGITDADVAAYREAKRERVKQGKTVLQPPAPKEAVEAKDPTAQANAVLAAAVASGMTGKALEDLKRTLLANLSNSAGIHVVAFPQDVQGVPAGFRAMDIRVIIPNTPSIGPQSGRAGFLNASLRGVFNGMPLTLEAKLYEYRPDQTQSAEEQAKRKARAVTEARFTVPQ